jgi:hypothetical protein
METEETMTFETPTAPPADLIALAHTNVSHPETLVIRPATLTILGRARVEVGGLELQLSCFGTVNPSRNRIHQWKRPQR